jgi:hypothetical protein
MTKLNTTKPYLSIAVISDIHLGHRRNTACDMVTALRAALPNNEETADLDIIFLAGDVFDRLLNLPMDDVGEIDNWIADLLNMCARKNIMLRILEGTPSHDWGQSTRFETIAQVLKSPVDMRHVKDLSIEYIEDFGINVLYVPDEWRSDVETTKEEVIALLAHHGLRQVDYSIMHGNFRYQVPAVYAEGTKHDESFYLDITKRHIFIGHIHTFSQYERIVAQGSFDRLSHGEEEPKGHVRGKFFDSGNSEITFVENTRARIYKTVNCNGLSVEETIERLKVVCVDLPTQSCVRIEAESTSPVFQSMEAVIRMFPMLVWSKKPVSAKAEKEVVLELDPNETYTPIYIGKDNIASLLIPRLAANGFNEKAVELSKTLLLDAMGDLN